MKQFILERMNKITAFFLLCIGIVALSVSLSTMDVGTFTKPEEGFTPVLFSSLLIGLSILNIVIEFITPNKVPGEMKDVKWGRFFLYFVICIAYVFFIKKIGFATDTFICLFLTLKLAGLKGKVKPVLISLISSVLIWALFTLAMGVPLPSGILI